MAESYDDKINSMISRREKIAAQKRAMRQQELRKQYAIIGVGILVLLLIVVLLFKSCGADKKKTTPVDNKQTTSAQITTSRPDEDGTDATSNAADDNQGDASQETTAAADDGQDVDSDGTEDAEGKKLYTTDILNFRVAPNTESELIVHIPKGAAVKVIKVEGDWCNISYKQNTGYVKYEYLSENKPE